MVAKMESRYSPDLASWYYQYEKMVCGNGHLVHWLYQMFQTVPDYVIEEILVSTLFAGYDKYRYSAEINKLEWCIRIRE